jgi:hypothetical protein
MGQNFAGADNPMTLRRIVNDLETKVANLEAALAVAREEGEAHRLDAESFKKMYDAINRGIGPELAKWKARTEAAEAALAAAREIAGDALTFATDVRDLVARWNRLDVRLFGLARE